MIKKKFGPRVKCRQCKDVIQSKSVHDFVSCKCRAIYIDGGGEYTRCGGNPSDFIYLDKKKQKPREWWLCPVCGSGYVASEEVDRLPTCIANDHEWIHVREVK